MREGEEPVVLVHRWSPRAWLLTARNPLMDCRICQTATASPAEPRGLPLTLVSLFLSSQTGGGERASESKGTLES
jgi:hypothetical protein